MVSKRCGTVQLQFVFWVLLLLWQEKEKSGIVRGLQQWKPPAFCQPGESSSFLFPAPASTHTPFPAVRGRLGSPIFLHRDIKVNYNLSRRLSSPAASPRLLWVSTARLLKQHILCDLCKNTENLSYRQGIFINSKARSCITLMRLFSLYLWEVY